MSSSDVRFYGSAAGDVYWRTMKRLRYRRVQRERSLANRDRARDELKPPRTAS